MAKRNTEPLRNAIMRDIFYKGNINAETLAAEFGVTAKTVYANVKHLEKEKLITSVKEGRNKVLHLVPQVQKSKTYETAGLQEDVVLSQDFLPALGPIPNTAKHVFYYIFTEMLNNAIEHSESKTVIIAVSRDAYAIFCCIEDAGVGIFSKIQNALGLEEKRFAILELAKGKFTTDPKSHTGEGVFFSSKAADRFAIFSDGLVFLGGREGAEDDYLMDFQSETGPGTRVMFEVTLNHSVPLGDMMKRFTAHPDDYGFSKTVIPVKLLEYQEVAPQFVSRSQARRLYARFDKFSNILLDFEGVEEIGQAFADEVFRVFPSQHPGVKIGYVNASESVIGMIRHVTDAIAE